MENRTNTDRASSYEFLHIILALYPAVHPKIYSQTNQLLSNHSDSLAPSHHDMPKHVEKALQKMTRHLSLVGIVDTASGNDVGSFLLSAVCSSGQYCSNVVR